MPTEAENLHAEEERIRDVVSAWMSAIQVGDLETVLTLMTDDVVFLVHGQEPIRGKASFAAMARSQSPERAPNIDGINEVQEIHVSGDWAYMWSRLTVIVTPPDGADPTTKAGHTLTIFRREGGRWLLARDANLLAPVESVGSS